MLPYKSMIGLQKDSDQPVYVQVANGFAREISNGLIKPNTKLPSTRVLGTLLKLHRNTVVAAYGELALQGWIQLIPKKGAFVSSRIPEIKPKSIHIKNRTTTPATKTGFEISPKTTLTLPVKVENKILQLNDGLPDERLAPVEELSRTYRGVLKRSFRKNSKGYTDVAGNLFLRKQLADFLNETRGLQTGPENIFITKGSQMGIFLTAQLLFRPGDRILVGETNYQAADATFEYSGAIIDRVPMDHLGLQVDHIEQVCKKKKIRAVYTTPHHHFPTTITMSACRRMNLMALSEKYGFAIIEDDYDYDFHYNSSPILPLGSSDNRGMVVYIGSLSKLFLPTLRVAFIVAPSNMVQEVSKLRFIIDRQGDPILEETLALLFQDGTMKRHIRKSLSAYRERRDLFCSLLEKKLTKIRFKKPDGGLAVWMEIDKNIDLSLVAEKALRNGLFIPEGCMFPRANMHSHGLRVGFASLNPQEMERAVSILSSCI